MSGSLPPFRPGPAIEQTIREDYGRILAALIKNVGDLQLAEDVLQDAIEAALVNWSQQGLPDSPAAWLIQTARRRAIDRFRRDSTFAKMQPELAYLAELEQNNQRADEVESVPDKRLELIFTCCHPSLERKTQIALTLRTLGGLTTEEIARAFLDKPTAMAQRLTRAKKKIALAGIPYEVPGGDVLPQRLETVLQVIYLIFNEGYSASSGERLTRGDLADEAIRLARITVSLLPDSAETAGLLALMLLHDSRRAARQDSDGEMTALQYQDRRLWNAVKIEEGTKLLQQTLRKKQIGPYQLQASISAVHAEAKCWAETDWPQIHALYELLYNMVPSPVVRINQSIATSYAVSIEAAIAQLQQLGDNAEVKSYQPWYAAMADLLQRQGETQNACTYLERAIELTENDTESRFLEQKLMKLKA